jgi:hypothetical protein
MVNHLLSGRFLTKEYVQANLPFIFFVVAIMMCYISYGYFAEKNVKAHIQTEADLRESKSRNLSANARLEKLKQRSSLSESIRHMGLIESRTPPVILRPNRSFWKKK